MNYSVLIVDDDEDDFILLKSHIKHCHQNVTLASAENGVAAVKKLTEGLHPNLILADAYMPLMSGYELLTWLMESPAYRHIPTIIWTGEMASSEVVRYYQAGANSVMMKPNALQEIEVFCKHWFELVQLPPVVVALSP